MNLRHAARSPWLVALVGPVVGFVHFMGVYVYAEAACNPGAAGRAASSSTTATTVAVVSAVALTLLAGLYALVRPRGDEADDDQRFMSWVGLRLSLLFAVTIVAVGAPVLVIDAC
jgi:hypothetical protein